MIKLENIVLPSPQQWMATIRGARNPLNSWNRMDSYITHIEDSQTLETADYAFFMGDNDHDLLMRLTKAGKDHRKFMRMIPVWIDITAPLYWWKEFDTYKVGTVANSCSTMHKIHAYNFYRSDFSCEHLMPPALQVLDNTITELNFMRHVFINGGHIQTNNGTVINFDAGDKQVWNNLIQLLPSSYNQKRTVFLNYEVLSNMYHARKNHKLKEWRDFCAWIESDLPYSELITCGGKPKVLYQCDGYACGEKCPNLECNYTEDVTHARNFHSEMDCFVEDLENDL